MKARRIECGEDIGMFDEWRIEIGVDDPAFRGMAASAKQTLWERWRAMKQFEWECLEDQWKLTPVEPRR